MSVIHIALTVDYLFDAKLARVLCDRSASDVIASGEFIGLKNNLNPKCEVCPKCKEAWERLT